MSATELIAQLPQRIRFSRTYPYDRNASETIAGSSEAFCVESDVFTPASYEVRTLASMLSRLRGSEGDRREARAREPKG